MQLRVAPDDIAAAGARLRDDGPALRELAALLGSCRDGPLAAAGGTGRMASAVDLLLDSSAVALGTLAETADLLAGGFLRAAASYQTADDAVGRTWRTAHG